MAAGEKLGYPAIQITNSERLLAGKGNWQRFYDSCYSSAHWFELLAERVISLLSPDEIFEKFGREGPSEKNGKFGREAKQQNKQQIKHSWVQQ